MNLEELIYQRFLESEELISYLAVFSGKPAVFCPEAPDDNQEGWESKIQYPKILYHLDMQANQERKSVGTLAVNLLCQNTAEVMPEEIEYEVKKCLRDVLLKPDCGRLYAFTWSRTDAFTIQEEKHDLIIGSEIRFDMHEYTCQETTDPDPIAAVNPYLKKLYPNSIVIGFDRMEAITKASKAVPIFYCRLTSLEKDKETNTVAWMNGRIAVHILCPDSEVRMKMVAAIANQMSLDGEIRMLDHSPMFLKRLQVNYESDYLRDGQIFITGHYGLLRYQAKPHSLQEVHIKCK